MTPSEVALHREIDILKGKLSVYEHPFEAIIDEKLADDHRRDSMSETIYASNLKQQCINVIAFGESLD